MRVVCGLEMLGLAWGYLNVRWGKEGMEGDGSDFWGVMRTVHAIATIPLNGKVRQNQRAQNSESR
jgi:hypothetical protein